MGRNGTRRPLSSGIKGSRTSVSRRQTKPTRPPPRFLCNCGFSLQEWLGLLDLITLIGRSALTTFMLAATISRLIHFTQLVGEFDFQEEKRLQEKEGGSGYGFYSPIIFTITVLSLERTSSSTKTICCQVPRINSLSSKGMKRLGPTREALTWECPLPSCHCASCS